MARLLLPDPVPFAGIGTALAIDDAMFDGRHDHYAAVGFSAARIIQRALRGRRPPPRILDLPCGHGRVTRVIRALFPEAHITVCDLDRAGVDFAATHFGTTGVHSHTDLRKLDLRTTFDLIWTGSLITHFSEQQTRQFLDFAVRHLAPEGTLMVTSHGAFVAERLLSYHYGLSEQAVRGLLADAWMNGYGFRNYPGGDGYGISLAQRRWYENLFAGGALRLDDYIEQGWDDHQDVLVLRPRGMPANKASANLPDFDEASPEPLSEAEQSALDACTVTGFNEAWYLASDSLVAQAVAAGSFPSGFAHYCAYGWREGRAICDPSLSYDARPRSAIASDPVADFSDPTTESKTLTQKLQSFILEVWQLCLGRPPNASELERSIETLAGGADPMMFLLTTSSSTEAIERRQTQDATGSIYPAGHYYSPVVDPDALIAHDFARVSETDDLQGIVMNYGAMALFITEALKGWACAFPTETSPACRYYSNNDMYGIGDATVLTAFVLHYKPKNWIEVGSGFSSAVLLDVLEAHPEIATNVTFIEPHTERLELLLREDDRTKTNIIKNDVQDVPLDLFDSLCRNDVLFLDTTHVAKTGSDVNHELFRIIPRLASGVIIHFHDVFDKFEYPDSWIYQENRSWNEQYILRAFLMYNARFEILFANNAFARHNPDVLQSVCPDAVAHSGGGLWLRKR